MAETFHEQVHTVLVDEPKDAIGTFANGLSDVRMFPLCRDKVVATDVHFRPAELAVRSAHIRPCREKR